MFDFRLFDFIKVLIVKGKLTVAYKVVCDCFFYLNVSFGSLYIWSALKTIEPVVEIRSLRRGGRIYFVPFPISSIRAMGLARRWVIRSSKKRKGKCMGHALAIEFKDAWIGIGGAASQRNQNQVQALANRGNVGFRWLFCWWDSSIGRAEES